MRRLVSFVLLVVFIEAGGPAVRAQDGPLDPTFGDGGRVMLPLGSFSNAHAQDAVLDPGGRIVVAGWVYTGDVVDSYDFAVARFNSDGSLDASFGTGGIVVTPVTPGKDQAQAVVLQPDGKVVVVGDDRGSVLYVSGSEMLAVRYHPDGTLDDGFGASGIVRLAIGGSNAVRDVLLQPDGKIVIAGAAYGTDDYDLALVRLLPDGAPDATFGQGGHTVVALDGSLEVVRGVARQPDGQVVIAGTWSGDDGQGILLARIDEAGDLDPTFGTGGLVTTPIGVWSGGGSDLVVLADGSLAVVGSGDYGDPVYGDIVVARYAADGVLDSSFGAGGIARFDLGGNEEGAAILSGQGGRLVVAGDRYYNDQTAVLLGLLEDGSLDPAFGADGVVQVAPGDGNAAAYALMHRGSSGLLAAGFAELSNTSVFATTGFTATGTLDPSFGTEGAAFATVSVPDESGATDVLVQPDGRVIAAGSATVERRRHYALARFHSDGTLDESFGEGGITRAYPPGGGGLYAATLMNDGRIVAAGSRDNTSGLTRFMPDGRLDPSFGAGGFAAEGIPVDVGEGAVALGVAVQQDGRVVIAGFKSIDKMGHTDEQFVVARYTAEGVLDPSFASGGISFPAVGTTSSGAHAVAVQPDGRILAVGKGQDGSVAGLVAVRYNLDGALDPSFSDDGIAVLLPGSGEANAVALLPDGRFVVAGRVGNYPGFNTVLIRCRSDGSLDPTFGEGGIVRSSNSVEDAGLDVALQPDGRLFVAGYDRTYPVSRFAVRVYTADGSLDGAFGENGTVLVTFGSASEYANAVAIQPDGKVVAAGSGEPEVGFALARFVDSRAVDVEGEQPGPAVFALHPPVPNPNRGRIAFTFTLPEAGVARFMVYDLLGREVAVLVDGPMAVGEHRASFDTSGLPAGTYVARLVAGEHARTRALTVIR